MHIDELEDHQKGRSKTQLKKRSLEVSKFTQRLGKLSLHQLERIGLPDEILEEFRVCHSLKSPNARNRQLKIAAALIREDRVWGCDEAAGQYDRIAQGKDGLRGQLALIRR